MLAVAKRQGKQGLPLSSGKTKKLPGLGGMSLVNGAGLGFRPLVQRLAWNSVLFLYPFVFPYLLSWFRVEIAWRSEFYCGSVAAKKVVKGKEEERCRQLAATFRGRSSPEIGRTVGQREAHRRHYLSYSNIGTLLNIGEVV